MSPSPLAHAVRTHRMETQPNRRRRVLLCIADERPHIVTQAMYGLAVRPDRWLPDEVIAVTSERGALEVQSRLIRHPRFDSLCQQLMPSDDHKPRLNVEVVRSAASDATAVASIAMARHRRDLSNCILRAVQKITDDSSTELCVMLGAEGPALNSFVAGHTLSLLGRPQDWLAQIVVDDDDARGDFFFPRGTDSAGEARVGILEIPFARVESVASVRQLVAQTDYGALCHGLDGHAHLQVSHDFQGLSFRFSNAFDIRCDSSHRVTGPRIEPRAAALYAYYADRASRNAPFVSDDQLLDEPDTYLEMYDACLLGGDSKTVHADRPRSLTRAALSAARSRIGSALAGLIRQGSSYADYRIYRRKDRCAYGLNLRPEQVVIVTG
ncbi:MAG: hypothetical protein AAFU65_06790 [Pseudomonadota bacterium]